MTSSPYVSPASSTIAGRSVNFATPARAAFTRHQWPTRPATASQLIQDAIAHAGPGEFIVILTYPEAGASSAIRRSAKSGHPNRFIVEDPAANPGTVTAARAVVARGGGPAVVVATPTPDTLPLVRELCDLADRVVRVPFVEGRDAAARKAADLLDAVGSPAFHVSYLLDLDWSQVR